jgi:hypothetical protein
MHENWWGWLAAFIIFAIIQAWRALFRSTKGTSSKAGMARLNAAAERILKERGTSVSNPIPRTQSKGNPKPSRGSAVKSRSAPLPKSTTPAVIRRSGILSSGREPVIQRRR